jgi:hypothetical protein
VTTPIETPSDRSFGFTFAVVFALVGGWLIWHANRAGIALLGGGGAFAALAALAPRRLHGLNVVWMRFGLLLNGIVSPIVIGAIFVVVFVPVGIAFRLRGRDALRRTFEPGLNSYWVDRSPPGPDRATFPRQF